MSSNKKHEPFTCQLCGKTDETVDIWCGGYINYAHHECAEIGNKALRQFIRYILADINGLEILAKEIVDIAKQMREGVEP